MQRTLFWGSGILSWKGFRTQCWWWRRLNMPGKVLHRGPSEGANMHSRGGQGWRRRILGRRGNKLKMEMPSLLVTLIPAVQTWGAFFLACCFLRLWCSSGPQGLRGLPQGLTSSSRAWRPWGFRATMMILDLRASAVFTFWTALNQGSIWIASHKMKLAF